MEKIAYKKIKEFFLRFKKYKPSKNLLIIFSVLLFIIAFSAGTAFFAKQKTQKNNKLVPTPTITTTPKATPSASLSITPAKAENKSKTINPTPIPTSQPTNTPTPVKDTSAPVVREFGGPADGSTVDFTNFCFPIYATDASKPILSRAKFDSDSWNDWGTNFENCYSNISFGSHSFSVQLKDNSGNETPVFTRNFKTESSEITVTLGGHIFSDKNCNTGRDEGESDVTGAAGSQVNFFKQPEFYILSTNTLDNSGGYSFSKTIKNNESLSVYIVPVAPPGYKINIQPITVTLDNNNKSRTVDFPAVPNENIGFCGR